MIKSKQRTPSQMGHLNNNNNSYNNIAYNNINNNLYNQKNVNINNNVDYSK